MSCAFSVIVNNLGDAESHDQYFHKGPRDIFIGLLWVPAAFPKECKACNFISEFLLGFIFEILFYGDAAEMSRVINNGIEGLKKNFLEVLENFFVFGFIS